MSNKYNLNKTGQEVDNILDGVVPVNFNITGVVPDDYCNAIKIGDVVYAIVGIPSPASTDKIYKHSFKFMYGTIELSGTMLITRSAAYSTPFDLFSNIVNSIKTQVLGSEIITTSQQSSVEIRGWYISNTSSIAFLNITTAMTFTEYNIIPY